MSELNVREKVSSYYDEYASRQQNVGINVRHLSIFNNIKKLGLNPNSKILEIGCGVGTFTYFIASQITTGKILAVDISPKSIEIAKEIYKNKPNMEFMVSDMSDFERPEKFDIVVLPDVLEHIPIEQHKNLFAKIAKHIHENSAVLINIPDPRALEWIIRNRPELLQVIDQPLHTNLLVDNFYSNGLFIESLNSYALFYDKPDYQSIVLRPNLPIKYMDPKTGFFLKIRRFILRKLHI
jgi:trans-aconitate 2-methyltransferase